MRGKLQAPEDTDEDALKEMALKDEKIIQFLAGAQPKKIIVVRKKLVNIVI